MSVLVIIAWYSPIARVNVNFPVESVWADVTKTGLVSVTVDDVDVEVDEAEEVDVDEDVEVDEADEVEDEEEEDVDDDVEVALILREVTVETDEKYTIAFAIGVPLVMVAVT